MNRRKDIKDHHLGTVEKAIWSIRPVGEEGDKGEQLSSTSPVTERGGEKGRKVHPVFVRHRKGRDEDRDDGKSPPLRRSVRKVRRRRGSPGTKPKSSAERGSRKGNGRRKGCGERREEALKVLSGNRGISLIFEGKRGGKKKKRKKRRAMRHNPPTEKRKEAIMIEGATV